MLTTFYKKETFELPDYVFSLYEPTVAEVVTRDGKEYIKNYDGTLIETIKASKGKLVRDFKPDANNMLIGDFKSKTIIVEEWHGNQAHMNCKVQPYKVGGYIQVKCLDCGIERKLAINSGVAVSETNKKSCK